MKVENENHRQEMPEGCDCCEAKVKLERLDKPEALGHKNWLCKYCTVALELHATTTRNLGAMFNVLEKSVKNVDYIPIKASFAQAPEWEDAIEAAIKVWLEPTSLGDRRKVIGIFNTMLSKAPVRGSS